MKKINDEKYTEYKDIHGNTYLDNEDCSDGKINGQQTCDFIASDISVCRPTGYNKDDLITKNHVAALNDKDWLVKVCGKDIEAMHIQNVIDRKTMKVINTIDLTKAPDIDKTFGDFGERPERAVYSNGIITATTNLKERDYDPLTGEVLDTRKLDAKAATGDADTYKIGAYLVMAEIHGDEVFDYSDLHVISPDGKITVIPIRETNTSVNVSYVIAISDTKALVVVNTGRDNLLKELDLTTAQLTDPDPKAYEWLDTGKFTSSFTGTDGSVYCSSSSGLSKINAGKKLMKRRLISIGAE